MKKVLVYSLLTVVLVLTGCASEKQNPASAQTSSVSSAQETTPSPSLSPSPEAASSVSAASSASEITPSVTPASSYTADIHVLLEEIKSTLRPGTAGSSLVSASVAAHLLDFAASTELSAEKIKEETSAYVKSLTADEQAEMLDKASSLGEMIATFQNGQSDIPALLEDAGVSNSNYPWTPSAYENANALLQGCGL